MDDLIRYGGLKSGLIRGDDLIRCGGLKSGLIRWMTLSDMVASNLAL
jgi:hypothetical protein